MNPVLTSSKRRGFDSPEDEARNRICGRIAVNDSGCHIWQGQHFNNGYAQMKYRQKCVGVHRLIWELTNGPIPAGLFVCHKCDVRNCVNLDHLFLGTPKDNHDDMAAKGRRVSVCGDQHPLRRCPSLATRGDSHPNAKMNAERVRELRLLSAQGETQIALAARYGVTQTTVSHILLGKVWRHV